MRIAVIGSGIAGLGAAWLLAKEHEVTLYERDVRLGGHSNTIDIQYGDRSFPIDTGFIVYNSANYPNLIRLFNHIGVSTDGTNMSFSVSALGGDLEYEGSLLGAVAQPINLLKPWYLGMWRDTIRFYKTAPASLENPDDANLTLGTYLDRQGYGDAFRMHHILPMAAAIWSCPIDTMLAFPLRSFVRFFINHGLFSLTSRPQWRTVTGGSRVYVKKLADRLGNRVRLDEPICSVRRLEGGVLVKEKCGKHTLYDQVIIGAHGDQTIAMLEDPSDQELKLLSAFRYQKNIAVLHRDPHLMPRRRHVWASWNYLSNGDQNQKERVSLTYWMNKLQNIDRRYPVFVTMNPLTEPDPALTFATFNYEHPIFDSRALDAQELLPAIQGTNRTWYCGSYCGYGFHEDGLKSAIAVARGLGAEIPWLCNVTPANELSSCRTGHINDAPNILSIMGG
ncbi:MAG: NAD/FAD-binding protein [Rhodospirillaceae bacterium]|nr:NAD/FAD-binding protein [Rhodospirillaceae bacterium]